MREWAAAHGGECLSNEYVNAKTKLLWRCSCGHEFWAMPTNVQRGEWCPKCKGKKYGTRQVGKTWLLREFGKNEIEQSQMVNVPLALAEEYLRCV